jgi:hypothetical protein
MKKRHPIVPPGNHTDKRVEEMAEGLGLDIEATRDYLLQYALNRLDALARYAEVNGKGSAKKAKAKAQKPKKAKVEKPKKAKAEKPKETVEPEAAA